MKLFDMNGAPYGITIQRQKSYGGRFVMHVKSGTKQTSFSVNADNIAYSYERAVYERLAQIDRSEDKELERMMLGAFPAFCEKYQIDIAPKTIYVMTVKGEFA